MHLSHPSEIALMRYSIKDTNFLILKRAHDALVREWEAVKREFYARKFDPNQPRAPVGNPDGGQWIGGGETVTSRAAGPPTAESNVTKVATTPSASFCWNQMLVDFLLCDSLGSRSIIGACRSQAMERYSACLRGKLLPPLPF